jgi:hypothetical protein
MPHLSVAYRWLLHLVKREVAEISVHDFRDKHLTNVIVSIFFFSLPSRRIVISRRFALVSLDGLPFIFAFYFRISGFGYFICHALFSFASSKLIFTYPPSV